MSDGRPSTKTEREEADAIVRESQDLVAATRRIIRQAESVSEMGTARFRVFLFRLGRIQPRHAAILRRAAAFNDSAPVEFWIDLLPARDQLNTLILDFVTKYLIPRPRDDSCSPAAFFLGPNINPPRNPVRRQRRRTAAPAAHRELGSVRPIPNNVTDEYSYVVRKGTPALTKRMVRSEIGRIGDQEFGLLSPVVLRAFLLFRQLCSRDVDWDQPLPASFAESWQSFISQLPVLENLSIPYRLHGNAPDETSHLIGFCGASNVGYVAVIYLRTTLPNGQTSVVLFKAKCRIAPRWQTSIPRLQLCAAHELAKLLKNITSRQFPQLRSRISVFCDLTPLAWISSDCYPSKQFVRKRVAAIRKLLPHVIWRSVQPEDNPANCAARGMEPAEILHHKLWWHGPAWLASPMETWPSSDGAYQLLSLYPDVQRLIIDDADNIPDGQCIWYSQLRVRYQGSIFNLIYIQLDGLPNEWATATTAFLKTDVDYAEPFFIIRVPHRDAGNTRTYQVIFSVSP